MSRCTLRGYLNDLIMSMVMFAVAGCGDAHHPAPDNVVLYGGMEEPGAWRLGKATIQDGVLRLAVENNDEISIASQLLPPLGDRGTLLLSIRAKADSATGDLNVDLYGFGWDSPLQELIITPSELAGEFRRYASLIHSGSSDMGIWLRLFTSSTRPIFVDEIVLRNVRSLQAIDSEDPCGGTVERTEALRE